MSQINILLVDDNAIIRKPLKRILNNKPNIKVIGECTNENEVITFLELNEVDVIFIDLTMKLMNSFETTSRIKKQYFKTKVVGLSFLDHVYYVNKIIMAGADGFISKFDVNQDIIITELKRVVGFSD